MTPYAWLKGRRGASGFGYASTAEEVTEGIDLHGKTILVTGVGSGLGQETARVLGMRGARILGAARTREKARAACAELPGEAVALACELSEPSSVRACVAEAATHGPIDAIVCNAGIMALRERTIVHGQELQFLTNHVGHFMLVTGLREQLREDARVVVLSSLVHAQAPASGIAFDDLAFAEGYRPLTAYAHSKLANLLFVRALAVRFRGTRRTANAVHPGIIATNLTRHFSWELRIGMSVATMVMAKSVPQGAATQCFVATHPSLAGVSGEYFANCNVARSSRHGRDEALAERLWAETESIVAAMP
jgi:NAD(P)-dependent dehydrogenase (short-subunit alcohol dehydrogenase family)